MNRRTFSTLLAGAPGFLRAAATSKPNLLLLMSDQHRADWMGCEGNRAVSTPNMDRLANEGVRFSHAYSSTPTCTPARAALLTGMSPWRHGMLGYGKVAEKYPVELPQLLRDAGYHTFGIGKMHWSPQRNLHGFHGTLLDESGRVESPGFRSDYRSWFAGMAPNLDPDATGIGWNDYTAKQYALSEPLHPTKWTGDCAVRFLETYFKPDPWFLKVSFARPHSPYDPPERLWKKYADADVPKAQAGKWADKYRERNSAADDIWHGDVGEEAIRNARIGYTGSVTFVDEQIGRILAMLQQKKMLDRTLIVYMSDHGDMTGDQWLWRKSYAYEPSSRIPMIVRGPGVERGKVNETPVEIRDILPTLAAAAGVPVPDLCDGQNMLTAKREWIDLEHNVCYDPANHWNALTDGKWKYIYHAFDGSEQLFDLATDPAESNDLSGDTERTATLRQWRSRMIALLEPRGPQWVKHGRLTTRPKSMPFSPNYPKQA